jgi:hypothetical protein
MSTYARPTPTLHRAPHAGGENKVPQRLCRGVRHELDLRSRGRSYPLCDIHPPPQWAHFFRLACLATISIPSVRTSSCIREMTIARDPAVQRHALCPLISHLNGERARFCPRAPPLPRHHSTVTDGTTARHCHFHPLQQALSDQLFTYTPTHSRRRHRRTSAVTATGSAATAAAAAVTTTASAE